MRLYLPLFLMAAVGCPGKEEPVEEPEAVERIVTAVVDAIADETGVAIEVEGEAGDEEAMDIEDVGMDQGDEDLNAAADLEDDADAAMRDPYNRKDVHEEGRKKDFEARKCKKSKTD